MSHTFVVLIILGMLSVLTILGLGLVSMVRGGEFAAKYSNRLMQARVAMQFVTIVLIVLAVVVASHG